MQQITTVAALREAIQTLEAEHIVQRKLLREQIHLTYESLRPVNLIRNTIKELFTTVSVSENLSGTAMGMAGGYLIKKLFVGKSENNFRKILGSVFQLGLSKVIEGNIELIRSAGHAILQYLFPKKKQ